MIKRIALFALPLLAACTTVGNAAPDEALTTWTFIEIDGKPPVSSKAKLRIYDGRIGATVGCNGMGGDLRIEGGRMIIGPVVSTQMYCEGLMEQERAVAELLGDSPIFFADNGRMMLRSKNHSAELKQAD